MFNLLLEWIGVISGLACVVLTARRRILCWPVGIVSVLAYSVFFFRIQLYADTALQGFFLVTGILGWRHWLRGGANLTAAPIARLHRRTAVIGGVIMAGAIAVIATTLARHTDASLPFWDTTTAVLAVGAQLLLMRKILESWVLWIAVDVLSISLYAVKEAYLTAGLYTVFLILATIGLIAWRRAWREEAKA